MLPLTPLRESSIFLLPLLLSIFSSPPKGERSRHNQRLWGEQRVGKACLSPIFSGSPSLSPIFDWGEDADTIGDCGGEEAGGGVGVLHLFPLSSGFADPNQRLGKKMEDSPKGVRRGPFHNQRLWKEESLPPCFSPRSHLLVPQSLIGGGKKVGRPLVCTLCFIKAKWRTNLQIFCLFFCKAKKAKNLPALFCFGPFLQSKKDPTFFPSFGPPIKDWALFLQRKNRGNGEKNRAQSKIGGTKGARRAKQKKRQSKKVSKQKPLCFYKAKQRVQTTSGVRRNKKAKTKKELISLCYFFFILLFNLLVFFYTS